MEEYAPSVRAKLLADQYAIQIYNMKFLECVKIGRSKVKTCALIAVNQTISYISDSMGTKCPDFDYWNEVRTELTNL